VYDELEGSGRGVIIRCYPSTGLEGLSKITKTLRIAGFWTEISIKDLPNTKQE
jgi:hypothetical protein